MNVLLGVLRYLSNLTAEHYTSVGVYQGVKMTSSVHNPSHRHPCSPIAAVYITKNILASPHHRQHCLAWPDWWCEIQVPGVRGDSQAQFQEPLSSLRGFSTTAEVIRPVFNNLLK